MVFKNKQKIIDNIETFAGHSGMVVMTLAVLISMAELAEREGHRVVVTLQPAYAIAHHGAQDNGLTGHGDEQARRGKEEIRHTSATYGAVMRSSAISGTV
jgi:hypothetical protein